MSATVRSVAVVLGRFLPVHNGHLFLFATARRASDALLVLVRSTASDPFPAALRVAWIEGLMGSQVRAVEVRDEQRLDPGDPDTVARWAAQVRRAMPPSWGEATLRVFAGEARAETLARALGAEFSRVDRGVVPLSGSQIRAAPHRHLGDVPAPVQMFLRARVP